MEFISKLDAASNNITGAIILYIYKNYLSSFTLSSTSYNVIQDLIHKKKLVSTLDEYCSKDTEFSTLPKNIKKLWNKIKHADKETDDLPIPHEEDARFMIAINIMDIIVLQHKIIGMHELFLAWYSASFSSVSKQFDGISQKLFPNLKNDPFDVKLNTLITSLKHNGFI